MRFSIRDLLWICTTFAIGMTCYMAGASHIGIDIPGAKYNLWEDEYGIPVYHDGELSGYWYIERNKKKSTNTRALVLTDAEGNSAMYTDIPEYKVHDFP